MSKKQIVLGASACALLFLVGFLALGAQSAPSAPAGPPPVEAQASTDQQVAAAAAKMGGGDFTGAATLLEKVVARDPSSALAWRYLGFAYLKQKKYPDARAAYGRLLGLVPDAPLALYNTAVSYAAEKNADAAFKWLARAKATKKIDMTQIQVDEDRQ